jgi:plastocyanin
MLLRTLTTLVAVLCAAIPSIAGDIEGTIIVKRKLSKRNVTPEVSTYDRGIAVELGSDQYNNDPLGFERSHVVVYLEGATPSEPVQTSMEQESRRFVPDLLVVPAGSSIAFPNRDLIFHNVFSLSKPKSFDLGNYPKGDSRTVVMGKPGIVYVNCHLHPNMSAAIVVTPNRWGTRVDPSGHFVLHDVPAGSYTIVAWHKTAGFLRQTVRVDAERPSSIKFLVPFEAEETTEAVAKR